MVLLGLWKDCSWLILFSIVGLMLMKPKPVILENAEQDVDIVDIFNEDIPVVDGDGGTITILEEEGVLVLTADNFHFAVAKHNPILVEFYTPWCGHCKSLEPQYAKAAQGLKEEGIRLAKVDATVEEKLAKEFGVSGFPTLKLFKDGEEVEDYDGARTADGLMRFMRERADPNYRPPPTAIVVATAENFSAIALAAPLALIEFYAPWCGHCKKLAPEFEAAAQQLLDYGVPLVTIDAMENRDLAQQYDVTGYPTLLVFRAGRVFPYTGGHDSAAAIVAYMKEQQRLPSQQLRSLLNARNAVAGVASAVVFAHFQEEGLGIYEEFIAAANELRGNLPFVHTFDAEVGRVYDVPSNSLAVIMPEIYHSQYEEKVKVMPQTALWEQKAVVAWVEAACVPLLGQRSAANVGFLYKGYPLLVVYGAVDFSHKHRGATQHLRHSLLPLAAQHHGSLTMALSNEEEHLQELQALGLEDSGEDVNVAIYTIKEKFAMPPSEDYVTAAAQFVEAFLVGSLKPHLRSQPVPVGPLAGTGKVQVVVAHSLQDRVMEESKDVLLEFYAPWCGHCKKLEPVLKKLAKQLNSIAPDVIVAKFDATANDIPALFQVKGFPTIFYVKATDKQHPVLYQGENTLKKLKAFVTEQRNGESPSEDHDEL